MSPSDSAWGLLNKVLPRVFKLKIIYKSLSLRIKLSETLDSKEKYPALSPGQGPAHH